MKPVKRRRESSSMKMRIVIVMGSREVFVRCDKREIE
jgi:hypothetical protein